MHTLADFEPVYTRHLQVAMAKKPEDYLPGLSAEVIVSRMVAAIQKKTIRGVNIDSPSFRGAAKELGSKNTYTAWREWGL